MNKSLKTKKFFVGVSGGVDSSVTAAILKENGYQVTGVFIKAWHPTFLPCNWRGEMRDAMRICAKLKIPFLLCDLEKEYKHEVIDYLISEYKNGRTPNPDVFCNKEIKFGHFLDWSINQGADFVATGHYARTQRTGTEVKMLAGLDIDKDQTYFLWTLSQEKLQKILFPIGEFVKSKVRKLAKQYNLHTHNKKDSQGLCFVGHVDMKLFLKRFIKTESGKVLDNKGNEIGRHEGSELYTFGQRHGFKINLNSNHKENYYVVDKNLNENTITVTEKVPKDYNDTNEIELIDVSFTRDIFYNKNNISMKIKPRYRSVNYNANLVKTDSKYRLKLIDDIEKIAPGQSVVFYIEDECIGGGIVK